MDAADKIKYERPCGKAFQEYGTDLDVQKFGDRLQLIDNWIVAARLRIMKLEEELEKARNGRG